LALGTHIQWQEKIINSDFKIEDGCRDGLQDYCVLTHLKMEKYVASKYL
jgi:hypothetical protein